MTYKLYFQGSNCLKMVLKCLPENPSLKSLWRNQQYIVVLWKRIFSFWFFWPECYICSINFCYHSYLDIAVRHRKYIAHSSSTLHNRSQTYNLKILFFSSNNYLTLLWYVNICYYRRMISIIVLIIIFWMEIMEYIKNMMENGFFFSF